MIPLERKNRILELLNKENFLSISELAERTYVSHMTVRRDLRELEKDGLIRFKRGGAENILNSSTSFSYAFRKTLDTDIKKELAQKAFRYIKPGETIFLDSSSTTTCIAEYLTPEMNVTAVTNSLQTANLLAEKGISFFLIGGCYSDENMAFSGYSAEKSAEYFNIDKMFFSSQGIVPGDYVYDSNEHDTRIHQIFLERSKKKYFLCISHKIGKKFMLRVCKTSDIDCIICDTDFPSGGVCI